METVTVPALAAILTQLYCEAKPQNVEKRAKYMPRQHRNKVAVRSSSPEDIRYKILEMLEDPLRTILKIFFPWCGVITFEASSNIHKRLKPIFPVSGSPKHTQEQLMMVNVHSLLHSIEGKFCF